MATPLLDVTNHLVAQVEILNKHVTPQAAPFILQRVIEKLDLKNAHPFTEVEEQKLCIKLSLEPKQLQDILETSGYIFEQAAYYGGSGDRLRSELTATGLHGDLVDAFVGVWEAEGATLRSKLSERVICPKTLESSDWSMSMLLGQNNMTRIKQMVATVSLTTVDQDHDMKRETVTYEMSHAELIEFSKHLDRIQDQLDALG